MGFLVPLQAPGRRLVASTLFQCHAWRSGWPGVRPVASGGGGRSPM